MSSMRRLRWFNWGSAAAIADRALNVLYHYASDLVIVERGAHVLRDWVATKCAKVSLADDANVAHPCGVHLGSRLSHGLGLRLG